MRIVVIGGTGHIGSYLVPQLVESGHAVVNLSRGQRDPYNPDAAWNAVERVTADRAAEEVNGTFGALVAGLRPEVVIDLTCYTLESATQLVRALRGIVAHFIHCGTIWVHGASVVVPTTEEHPRRPLGDYGLRKAAIERYLLEQAQGSGFPATVLHPGHLVGPGWAPITPAGNFDTAIFERLARGGQVRLPNFGMETLHHVHAVDVAQGFARAVAHRDPAVGESFHIVSPSALTLRGYAEEIARWFGREARLEFLPWEEWRQRVPDRDATVTLNHLRHSSHCSIEKAERRLGYTPGYTGLQAIQESIAWLLKTRAISAE